MRPDLRRFGVVATPDGGPERWIATARRVEELGYSTLLMPDGLQLLAPFPSLAGRRRSRWPWRSPTSSRSPPTPAPPASTWPHVGLRAAAGERDIELAMNLFVVGDEVPEWTRGLIGASAEELIAADSSTMLRGSTTEMVDELQRRRDAFGVSYVSVNAAFFEQLAPVVEMLEGK